MTRRELLDMLLGLPALTLAGCGHQRIPAARIAELYAAGELAAVESLMPEAKRVVVTGLVFHDWAYPYPERVDATQADPEAWREATHRGPDGGPVYHGIKLRLPGEHDEDTLHRSGPKLIAFLPYADTRAVNRLKRAYRERFDLRCTVSWIGVLTGEVWDENAGQVVEDDMVGLWLHAVRR